MKILLILSAVVAFAVGALGVSFSVAQELPTYKNSAEACKDFIENGFPGFPTDITLGECVNFFETKPVLECMDYEQSDPLSFYMEYKNLGDCINDDRPNEEPPPPPPPE